MLVQTFKTNFPVTRHGIEYARKVVEATRQLDGCGGIFLLSDGTPAGMAFVLWRDQASMDAAVPKENTDIARAVQAGIGVANLDRIYTVVVSA
jgi:hypothetical protein